MVQPERPSRARKFFAILLVLCLFATVLAAVAAWTIHTGTEDLARKNFNKLSLYQQILSSEIKRHEFLPYALAENRSIIDLLGAPRDPGLVDRVNRYLEEVSRKTRAAAVYVLNTDGLTLASSNWRSETSYVGHNYGFRPYFQAAMRGEAGRYFAIGATTFTPGYFLSHPVEIGGRIRGAVVLKLALDPLEQDWAEQPLEKVLVTDRNGVIIASSEPNWRFRTLAPLSRQRREELRRSRQFADLELAPVGVAEVEWLPTGRTVEKIATPAKIVEPRPFQDLGFASTYLAIRMPMADTDWTIHLLANMSPVSQQLVNALAVCLSSLLALALVVFYCYEHRLYTLEKRAYQARAKAALEASEAQLRDIIQGTRAALVTIDQDGAIESLNPTAEHFFGLAAGEVEGRSIKSLLFEVDHPRIDAYLAGARRQRGEDFSLETRGRRRDGSAFFVDLFISDLFPHRQYRFIVTIHNISKRKAAEDRLRQALEEQEERIRERTAELQASNRQLHHEIVERKRAEAILRETQNELIQASKLAALGQMSAGLTHELNQPLTALRTFCASGRLLLQRGLHDQVEENFGQIQELTERMAKLTSQLKTFARKSRGEILRVPVRLAIEQSFDLLANRIAQGEVEVVLNLPGAEVQLLGDQVRLEQVVINLVSNAVDAMAGRAQRRLAVDYRLTPKYLWLTFTDSGGGIPAEILPQIFDPFFTTKEVGEGLGLGLSIAYGIVKDWGGSLQAKNVEGGAEFTLKLPRFTGTGEKAS